jgi:hypothetical protein
MTAYQRPFEGTPDKSSCSMSSIFYINIEPIDYSSPISLASSFVALTR